MKQQVQISVFLRSAIPLLALFLVVLWSPENYAQKNTTVEAEKTKPNENRPASEILEKLRQFGKESKEDTPASSLILPNVWCSDVDDELTREVCWEAFRASLKYYDTGLTQRARVFTWQHLSTRIIFFTVLALVFIGLYFAWIQFNRDLKLVDKSAEKIEGKEHSVELSTSGIKVSSPVLGVIILALSLAFFYLYLVYVYPIVEKF